VGLLAAFAAGAGFGAAFWLAIGIAAVLLTWEHRLVRVGDYARLDAAFFTMNGIISAVIAAGAITDVLLA
jgi:4-hydroxybenzoate polyprenyltransferase